MECSMAEAPVPSNTHAVSSPGTAPSCSVSTCQVRVSVRVRVRVRVRVSSCRVSTCHADELTVIAESAKNAFIPPAAASARRRGAAPKEFWKS